MPGLLIVKVATAAPFMVTVLVNTMHTRAQVDAVAQEAYQLEAAEAERKAAQDAAKAERKAAQDAAEAERKAAQAERKAAQAERKAAQAERTVVMNACAAASEAPYPVARVAPLPALAVAPSVGRLTRGTQSVQGIKVLFA